VIYGYGCGCFQAWFGWLRSGVAPVALGLGDFSGGVVVLASPMMWVWWRGADVEVLDATDQG
jgi:hypothetical protein